MLSILLIILNGNCQTTNLEDYSYLCSKGSIPKGLLTSAYLKYQTEFPLKTMGDRRKVALKKKNFYLKSNYALNSVLESGRVVYGDEITSYINKVADEVLKNYPEVRRELQFYTLKSSSVNSFSTSQGYIFVNVGLIAKLNSEAELAFVIAHEVAHYMDEDALNSYIENIDLEKGKGKYNNLPFDDRIDQMFKNSRETELKADSVGTRILLASGYNSSAIISALDMLHFSYLPYEEVPFDKTFFNTESFIIPATYFLDSVKTISSIEDYKDKDQTHPNIFKRKQKVNEIIGEKPSNKPLYLVSELEFDKVKELARFEQIRIDLLRKCYGDAIYNSYVMLKKYPNNQFLRVSIAKALYGLALYKNIEEFQKVAKSYIRVEGESQQVHSMLKQLTKKQLNSLALSYTKSVLQDYPNDRLLKKIEQQLLEELVIKNRLSIKDYQVYYQNKGKQGTITSNATANFFLAALSQKEANSKEMATLFNKAKAKADSLQQLEDMPISQREAFEKNNLKMVKKYGANRAIDKVIFLDPFVAYYPLEKERDYVNSEEKEATLINAIGSFGREYGKPVSILKSVDLKPSETDSYNKISLYKEMVDDIFFNDDKIDLLPLGVPVSFFEKEKGNLVSRVGLISGDNNKSLLINIMVDLGNLDIIYTKTANIWSNYHERTLVKEFEDSFQILK